MITFRYSALEECVWSSNMGSASQMFYTWLSTISRMWQKRADSSDFVWLARFRLLSLYTLFKSLLLLAAGVAGLRLSALLSPSTRNLTPLLWLGIILGLCAGALLLVLGLVLASKRRPRSIGLVILAASDVCLLLAVIYASILDKLFILLVVLVVVSCTTPLLVERISRYAKRFLQSKGELASLKYERDLLLLQFTQQLARAIEDECQSLKREIHDGLMQELSALLLQVSIMVMRNSENGVLQLKAADVAKLEAALRRAVVEARSLMSVLRVPEAVLEKSGTPIAESEGLVPTLRLRRVSVGRRSPG